MYACKGAHIKDEKVGWSFTAAYIPCMTYQDGDRKHCVIEVNIFNIIYKLRCYGVWMFYVLRHLFASIKACTGTDVFVFVYTACDMLRI